MQELFTYKGENYIIYIWKFNNNNSVTPITKRKMYKEFIQQQIKIITGNPNCQLYFNKNNKPFINDNIYKSISISHTLDYLAIQLHKESYAGIDIETKREQLIKIKSKLLSDYESKYFDADLSTLCLIWATKEALFKIHGSYNIGPKNIIVLNITLPNISAKITTPNGEEIYTLYSHQIKPLTIVYVVKKH